MAKSECDRRRSGLTAANAWRRRQANYIGIPIEKAAREERERKKELIAKLKAELQEAYRNDGKKGVEDWVKKHRGIPIETINKWLREIDPGIRVTVKAKPSQEKGEDR